MSELRDLQASHATSESSLDRSQVYNQIIMLLRRGQVIGDDKLVQLAHIQDLIEAKTEQLEHDSNSFGYFLFRCILILFRSPSRSRKDMHLCIKI